MSLRFRLLRTAAISTASTIFALTFGGTRSLRAQSAITSIPDQPSCSTCDVQITPLVRLGHSTDPVGFGTTVSVAANSRGEFAVSSPAFAGEIEIYAPDGQWERAIGRRGHGPGEFVRSVLLHYDADDSLFAIERSGTRLTVFAPDYTLARTAPLDGAVLDFCIEPSGRVFTVGLVTADNRASLAQEYSGTGELLAAFDTMPLPSVDPSTTLTIAACDRTGARWAGSPFTYHLEKWEAADESPRRFAATRDWLSVARIARRTSRPSAPVAKMSRAQMSEQKPISLLDGLAVDPAGRLWVFSTVADEHWKDTHANPLEPSDASTDTMLEIVNGSTGALITTHRFDQALWPLGTGRAYSLAETDSGDRQIQIWSISLTSSRAN